MIAQSCYTLGAGSNYPATLPQLLKIHTPPPITRDLKIFLVFLGYARQRHFSDLEIQASWTPQKTPFFSNSALFRPPAARQAAYQAHRKQQSRGRLGDDRRDAEPAKVVFIN